MNWYKHKLLYGPKRCTQLGFSPKCNCHFQRTTLKTKSIYYSRTYLNKQIKTYVDFVFIMNHQIMLNTFWWKTKSHISFWSIVYVWFENTMHVCLNFCHSESLVIFICINVSVLSFGLSAHSSFAPVCRFVYLSVHLSVHNYHTDLSLVYLFKDFLYLINA